MRDDFIDLGAAMNSVDTPEVEDLPILSRDPGTFDLAPISLNLVPYERHVALMTQAAKSITVTDSVSQKIAVSAESCNKKLYKDLEVARKMAVAPYNAHVKKINNLFKTLTGPLLQNEATIKSKRGVFEYQLELERRRKEAEAREEQRRLQAKLDAEARAQREEAERKAREAQEKLEKEKDEATRVALEKEIEDETLAATAPTPQAPLMTERQEIIRTPEGSSYTKFVWKFRIIDPDKVAREFCSPDDKKLAAFVKGGGRQADGIIIEEVAQPVTRV